MTDQPAELARKKVFIKTYGCQMNVYDSDRMADALAVHGYERVDEAEGADLVVLNTCHIREKASEKVFSELGRLRQLRGRRAADGARMLIGVAGCVAQAEGDEIVRRAPDVDLVVGPQAYHRLPAMVAAAGRRGAGEPGLVDTDFPDEDKFAHLPAPRREATIARGLTAFLTVQEGCDKFCSFCVVPYTRGAETSRKVADIVVEATRLVDAGVKEITLLGQNVNAWHGADEKGRAVGLGTLLERLSRIEGLERLRYTTSHPLDMDDGLIAAHRDLEKLMPYLHLPVQSGSDAVLRAMNRRHTRADYLRVIERVRQARPDMALSGDFIVGFPGETEADFLETLAIVGEVGYASAFTFKYSVRPGTPGATMADQVPEPVKIERLARLQEAVTQSQRAFSGACVGRRLEVLFERVGRKPGQLAGRSPYLQAVQVEAPETLVGSIRPVTITATGNNSLFGEIDSPDGPISASFKPPAAVLA